MTDLHLDATSRTPTISLDRTAGILVIAGESYPEDDITREFAEDIAAEIRHASVFILDLDAEQDDQPA